MKPMQWAMIGGIALIVFLWMRSRATAKENRGIEPPRSKIFEQDQRSSSLGTSQSASGRVDLGSGALAGRFNLRIGA